MSKLTILFDGCLGLVLHLMSHYFVFLLKLYRRRVEFYRTFFNRCKNVCKKVDVFISCIFPPLFSMDYSLLLPFFAAACLPV